MSKPAAPAQKFVPRSRYSGDGEGGPLGKGKGKGSMHSKEDKDEDGTTGRQGAWMGSRAKGGKGNKEHHRGPPGGGGGDDVKQEDTGKEGGRGFWQSHKASAPAPEGNDRFTGLGKYMAPGAKRREAEKEKEKERERDRHHDGDERLFVARRGPRIELDSGRPHPLTQAWSFSYRDKERKTEVESAKSSDKGYDVGFIHLGDASTVEQFWSIYTHLAPPDAVADADYCFFLKGKRPVWEDFLDGSRIALKFSRRKVRATSVSDVWETLLLHIIGRQFSKHNDEIVGCVVQHKTHCDRIALWVRTSEPAVIESLSADVGSIARERVGTHYYLTVLEMRDIPVALLDQEE